MRSWRATGQYGYWVIRENDPEGTGSIGEAIRLSAGNKKAAFDIAALLTEAYQSGRDDHAAERLAETLRSTPDEEKVGSRIRFPELMDLITAYGDARNHDGRTYRKSGHSAERLLEKIRAALRRPAPLKPPSYPALGEDLADLPPGEHLVQLGDDGVLHLGSPSAAILFVVGTRVNVYSDRHPSWRGTVTRNNMVVARNGRLLGWYVVTDDVTGQEWEVLPANLMPEEKP